MLLQHLLLRELAGEHALIEMFDVHIVEMPDDNRQDCQQGLPAVGGFGGWDELTR